MIIQADDHGRIHRNKRPHQQPQQDVAQRMTRPGCAIEHAVIILELALVLQSHYAQGGGHGAFAGCQDCADDQNAGPCPDPFAEDHFKVAQYLYNRRWQVAHGSSLSSSWV